MARFLRLMFFIIIVLINGFQILDAAELPVLTCKVTKIDTSFWYQIFGKPNSTGYSSCWEDKNRKVIVNIKSIYNTSIVKSLHEDSVELFVCEDFLRYNMERHEKDGTLSELTATCEVNCTDLMAKDSDGFPNWGIAVIVLGIILPGIFIVTIFIFGKRLLKQVDCRFLSQNSCSSRTNGLQPSQPLTQSEAEAIKENLQNEQVSISMTT
ncbi:uncharacterized protein LOC111947383 isoform X2 [Oryzias latipes]|uniref:uncharacterized protein LOC111947383 isoform X2 n=1 Tax=Oryzias latipes TaxID=8090 RepID=UPI000CE28461|nr:uncharacterized protein LOC111947383 isoform X2 [Oryzias latipes]